MNRAAARRRARAGFFLRRVIRGGLGFAVSGAVVVLLWRG